MQKIINIISCNEKQCNVVYLTPLCFIPGSIKPEGLSVTALKEESYTRGEWGADLIWSLPQWSDQSSHRFKITYQSGTGPNIITKITDADSYSTTLTGLQPDTKYTASVSTVLQDGRESDPAFVTFQTSELNWP